MGSTRSTYWDTVKAFLIILVVLGHMGTALNHGLLSVIYAFHMPLFVFVSGYFSRKRAISEFSREIKRLIIIYLVFDVLYMGFELISGESLISLTRLLTPSFAMWYILSLIYWRTILQFLPEKVLNRKLICIVISLVCALIAGFVPVSTQMSFQRTFVFLPFFLMGYYVRKSTVVEWIRNRNKILITILFVGLCVVCYMWMQTFYANVSYALGMKDMLMRLLQMSIAVILCAAMLSVVPERMGHITDLGKVTLLIYLLHPPMVKLAKIGCAYIGIPMAPNIPMAILITVLCVIFIYNVRMFKLFKYIS